ncbi:histidine kinase [Actinoplanes sp. TRM 88003]|uniref:Histidine kinase n=1 Tax=Paractinoplanes aksuensis TaxID=2939490 RepID=A0ABT1DRT5_9ACTN|nr:MHYT domain-containing protein [Actinoplanes aksuensis]MCO8272725.1 histidine kinase [Actinoplanes aksuensis]
MAEVHHFTYGAFNPIAAFLLAFLGSFFGLLSTARARGARTKGRRNRWLLIGAFAIGGGAIWLMHFAAMLGFEVPASPVRFDVPMTLASLAFAVFAVGAGLLIVGHGRRSLPKTLVAGGLTGGGVLAMHYTGMLAMHVAGDIQYNLALVVASAVIAVVASTIALWFTVSVRGWAPISGAAAIMAIAVCGMHYTGMAALSVHLEAGALDRVVGFRPLTLILPITLITAATIIGVALSALQAMTEEEFTDGAGTPRRGAHAEAGNPWSLKQATIATAGRRPSPRPVPMRSPTNG